MGYQRAVTGVGRAVGLTAGELRDLTVTPAVVTSTAKRLPIIWVVKHYEVRGLAVRITHCDQPPSVSTRPDLVS